MSNNEQSSSVKTTRGKSRFAIITLSLICALLAITLAVVISLPLLLEAQINGILQGMIQNGAAGIKVRAMGLSATDISCHYETVDADGKKTRVATIGSLTLNYNIYDLLINQTVDSIEVENADMLLEYDPATGNIDFPLSGLIQSRLEDDGGGTIPDDLNIIIPVAVKKIHASGSIVARTPSQELIFIPFAIKAQMNTTTAWNNINFEADAAYSSNRISVSGDYSHTEQTLDAKLGAKLSISTLPLAIRQNLPRTLRTSIEFNSDIQCNLKDFTISDSSLLKGSFKLNYRTGKLRLASDMNIELFKTEKGFRLNAGGVGGSWDNIDFSANEITIETNGDFSKINGSSLLAAGDGIKAKSDFTIERLEDKSHSFAFNLSAVGGQSIEYAQTFCTAEDITFSAEGVYSPAKGVIWNAQTIIPKLTVTQESASCSLKSLSGAFSGENVKFDGRFNAKNPVIESAMAMGMFPEAVLETAFDGNSFSIVLKSKAGTLAMPDFSTALKKIDLEIPLVYPSPESNSPAGKITIGEGLFQGKKVASFSGVTSFENNKARLDGKIDIFANHANLTLEIIPFAESGFSCKAQINAPEQPLAVTKELEQFMPELKKIKLEGLTSFICNYELVGSKQKGNLDFKLKNTNLSLPEMNLTARNINVSFNMPHLPELYSMPDQKLTFESFEFDTINFGKGFITFRMESPTSYRLENALVNWCGGRIRMGSTTFTAGQDKYDMTIFCDRLKLTDFLKQIGLGDLAGDGSISGSIPLSFSKNSFAFDDAFMYSTPGETGEIKGNLNETIIGGAAAPIELAIAREALRDFTYSWVKLSINSAPEASEELKLKLQLDGKPKNELYFKYDEKIGSFAVSDIPCRFQGIRLDVNINVNFDKAMKLYDYFNTFFNRKGL